MRLIQFETHDGDRRVAVSDGANNYLRVVSSTQRIYELAVEATRTGVSLETLCRLHEVIGEFFFLIY